MNPALPSREVLKARERLVDHVGKAVLHLRAQAGMRAAILWFALVSILLPVLILLQKLFSLESLGFNIYLAWGGILLLGIPYIIQCMFSRKIHETLAATLADERLGLHSRLSTAMSLDPADPSGFSTAFYEEAYDKLRALNPEKAFQWRTPRIVALLPFMLVTSLALWYLVPQQDRLGFKAKLDQKALKEAKVKGAGEKLSTSLQDLTPPENPQREDTPGDHKIRQLLQKAKDVAQQAKDGKLSPEETVLAMDPIKREIEQEKEKIGDNGKDLKERLQKLADKDLNMQEGDLTKEVSEALKTGDLQAAAEQMRKLARDMKKEIQENSSLTPEQKQEKLEKLKQEVEKLAEAVAQQEDLKKDMQEISKKSMDAKDYQALQDEIKKHEEKEGGKTQNQKAQDLEQAMNQAADDLENLEAGGDENMTDEQKKEKEQLDKMEDALDEAGQEANNSEMAPPEGQEGQQGQQGQKGEKGQKQSGSQKGQQAGGKKGAGQKKMANKSGGQSGQEGGQTGKTQAGGEGQAGKGDKNGPPGNGQTGGGPGQGKRAYRDGDAEFEKQKVQGKLQSGSITGLSHFRGQGAKGEAPVQFQENFAAAEQESAASMELDRMPADTREMIKNYFLTVKKDTGIKNPPGPGEQAPEPETGTRGKLKE